MAETL